LTSGTSYVNRIVKAPICQKSCECKYIKVHEEFWYSGTNSHVKGSGGQSEIKMQEAELELHRLWIKEQVTAVMLLGP